MDNETRLAALRERAAQARRYGNEDRARIIDEMIWSIENDKPEEPSE